MRPTLAGPSSGGWKMHVLPTPGAAERGRSPPVGGLWRGLVPGIPRRRRTAENGISWAANIEDLPEQHTGFPR